MQNCARLKTIFILRASATTRSRRQIDHATTQLPRKLDLLLTLTDAFCDLPVQQTLDFPSWWLQRLEHQVTRVKPGQLGGRATSVAAGLTARQPSSNVTCVKAGANVLPARQGILSKLQASETTSLPTRRQS